MLFTWARVAILNGSTKVLDMLVRQHPSLEKDIYAEDVCYDWLERIARDGKSMVMFHVFYDRLVAHAARVGGQRHSGLLDFASTAADHGNYRMMVNLFECAAQKDPDLWKHGRVEWNYLIQSASRSICYDLDRGWMATRQRNKIKKCIAWLREREAESKKRTKKT